MENNDFGDLRIEVSEQPGVLRLEWLGKSNDRQPGKVLDPFFTDIARRAQAGNTSIEMHFEKLEFFNSSTITCIIQLIQDLRAKNVRLVIVFDSSVKWQKLSFDALRIFEKADGLLQLQQPA